MQWILAILVLILTAAAGSAQDEPQRDRGILQAFLEDNLSDAGREVRITGFEGAISSRATVEELTIADDEGVWLTLRDAALDWSRAELIRGRLEINELSAGEVIFSRWPGGGGATKLPSAEATPFSLPELPVSVNIGKIAVSKLTMAPAVLGRQLSLRAGGSLALEAGSGRARIAMVRTDGETGALSARAAFSNATGVLDLDLSLFEGPDGIVSHILKLPDRPALALEVKGDAPLSDFRADMKLATNGEERLAGWISAAEEDMVGGEGSRRRITAELSGDVTPLFAPDLKVFFGPDTRLSLSANRMSTGRFTVDRFLLSAAQAQLSGSLDLDPDGMPARFEIEGTIGGDGQVRLPVPGPTTHINHAGLVARFDAEKGERWQVDAQLEGLERAGLRVERARTNAEGTISTRSGRQISAVVEVDINGITHRDDDLAQAIGESVSGGATLDWTENRPVNISALNVLSDGLRLQAKGQLDDLLGGLRVVGEVKADSEDLSRFSGVTGQALTGSVGFSASGRARLLTGAFDVTAEADSVNLGVGLAPLDGLLAGRTHLLVSAIRDETGTELRRLNVDGNWARVSASGRISREAGQAAISASLPELGRAVSELAGPASLDADISWQTGQPLRVAMLHLEGAGARLDGEGSVDLAAEGNLPASGSVSLSVQDMSAFSELADRDLRGYVDLSASGHLGLRGGDFDLSLNALTRDLAADLGNFDRLLTGEGHLSLAARRTGQNVMVDTLSFDGPNMDIKLASSERDVERLQFDARISDLSLLAPGFPGPVTVSGDAKQVGTDWDLALDGSGPGGTSVRLAGRVAGDASQVDLSASGRAPLALANGFIAPNSIEGAAAYDLRIAGKPALSVINGTVSAQDARLSLLEPRLVVENLGVEVAIDSGMASIAASGGFQGGGRVSVSGPVYLTAPYQAALKMTLADAVVRDPELYRTSVTGALLLQGDLVGVRALTGSVDLGPTEVQIPSSGAAPRGSIPENLLHVHEPTAVHATRVRAGLVDGAGNQASGAADLKLDLTIRAPNQICVRGRGLDAELGGQLRLTGSAAEVIPIGQFDLIRGRLDILGKRLQLESGLIRLQGALDGFVRLVATTQTDDDTQVQVVIEGPLSEPEVEFQSQPELPQDEVVARLLFGRGIDNVSPFQAARLAAALATLSGKSEGGVVAGIRERFGLDDLDVATGDEGATTVRFGKYLSDNIYTDVAVDSEGKSEINLNLDVTRQVKVKGTLGSEGETKLGIFYERDY